MSSPPAKRQRRYACWCPACHGQERDHRTVTRHGQFLTPRVDPPVTPPLGPPPVIPPPPVTLPLGPPVIPTAPDTSVVPPLTPPAPNPVVSSVHVPPLSTQKVTRYVLKEALSKLERGHSQSEIEQHLTSTRQLLGVEVLPKNCSEVLQLMHKMGYKSPRHYKVCCGRDHSMLLVAKQPCALCDKPWSECIDYYVVGLNFHDWFLTDYQCATLLGHWEDRETWLGKPVGYDHPEKSELWHGKRSQVS